MVVSVTVIQLSYSCWAAALHMLLVLSGHPSSKWQLHAMPAAGQLTFCAPTMDARQQACDELQQQTGATFIPPYNYGPVISGQGTIALELLQQVGCGQRQGQAWLQGS